jgi:hypothetical protein
VKWFHRDLLELMNSSSSSRSSVGVFAAGPTVAARVKQDWRALSNFRIAMSARSKAPYETFVLPRSWPLWAAQLSVNNTIWLVW